jgi:hypothetical protein
MKTTLFVLCLLCATAALGQTAGGVMSAEPQVFHPPDHAQRAASQSMAAEQNLRENVAYTSAQGEKPLWEVMPAKHEVPLGDVARALRKDHLAAKKADFVRND